MIAKHFTRVMASAFACFVLGAGVAHGQGETEESGQQVIQGGQMGVIQLQTSDGAPGKVQVFSAVAAGNDLMTTKFGFDSHLMYQDPFSLASNPQLQDELGLLEEQKAGIKDLARDFSDKLSQTMRPSEDGNLSFDPGNLKEIIAGLNEQRDQQLNKILMPNQRERLQQIALQMEMKARGDATVLAGQRLSEELGIDDEQKKRIRDKAQELQERIKQEIARLKQQARQELLQELTPQQRQKLQELVGDDFQPNGRALQRPLRNIRQQTPAKTDDK